MRRGLMYIKEFAPSSKSTSVELGVFSYNAMILATSEHRIMVFKNPETIDFTKEIYHVCKLTTKEVLALPNPKRNQNAGTCAIVVMGLKPLCYKIIRFPNHP